MYMKKPDWAHLDDTGGNKGNILEIVGENWHKIIWKEKVKHTGIYHWGPNSFIFLQFSAKKIVK